MHRTLHIELINLYNVRGTNAFVILDLTKQISAHMNATSTVNNHCSTDKMPDTLSENRQNLQTFPTHISCQSFTLSVSHSLYQILIKPCTG